MSANRLIVDFLGTNGWYDTTTGNTVCTLIETPNEYIILDAGNGLYKIDRHIKQDKPIYLFISHFHLDHLFGLHVLAKFKFNQGLTIVVRRGGRKILTDFVSRKYTAPLYGLKTKIKVIELSPEHRTKNVGQKSRVFPFGVTALPLRHPVPCHGFRFDFDGKIVSYIADTGECANAYKLAAGADLVISECAYLNPKHDAQWPHLDPKTAAKIAKEAAAGRLALTHFDAAIYLSPKDRQSAQNRARQVFKNCFAASDDQMEEI